MRARHDLVRVASLGVVGMLTMWSCGGTPRAPTAASPSAASIAASGPVTSSGARGATTWECFTAASAGIFASSGCSTSMAVGAQAVRAFAAPANPFSLQASVSGSTVTLTWQAPASGDPPTSYVVEAGSSTGARDVASFDTGNALTSLTVPGVPAGSYFVRVYAKNSSGTSSVPTNQVFVNVGGSAPPPCTPLAPTGLTGSVSGSTVTLNWSAPGGTCPVVNYFIDAGSASGRSDLASDNIGLTTSFSATQIPAGTYYVRIRAANRGNSSPPSNEVTITVAAPAPPAGSTQVTFLGLVSNGDGLIFPNDPVCGVEKADLLLVFNVLGNSVTGTATLTLRVAPGGTDCDAPGRVQTNAITGTLSGSTLTLNLIDRAGQSNPGTATVTSTRITGSFNGFEHGRPFVLTFSANRQ